MKPLLLALLFTAELAAADPARDARWQQDLAYLATQLPQRHPDFDFLVPSRVFFGAEQADIVYSGAFPGYWQANVNVPDTAHRDRPGPIVRGD